MLEAHSATGIELRAFVSDGAEHRADLRIELFGPDGARYAVAVAFAAPPYRVLGLQLGDWRVAVAGPALDRRSGAVRLGPDRTERLCLTSAAPTLDELPWPLPPEPPAADFTADLEHLELTPDQAPAVPLPAAAVPASW